MNPTPVEKPAPSPEIIDQLRATLGKLEVALGATQDSIAWTDALGRIEWCNAPFDRLAGRPHMSVIGLEISEVLPLGRAGRQHPAHLVLEKKSFASDTINVSRDGRASYLDFFGSWVQGGGIAPIAVFVLRDVTSRVLADQALEAKSRELERSNAELQQFASAASHDLMEPLRKVSAFGDLLRKRAAEALDPTSLDFLQRMQQAAIRMGKLIDDLLQFSRVLGDARPFERVDLGVLTREVLSDLERAIQDCGALIDVGSLPDLEAHPFQIRQLFQNLIANALKFRRPDGPPHLTIKSRPGPDGFVELEFRDDGIGFDEKYADKIFQPFLKLHTRTEYEGTGLGLAICRRILLRHGGWITAHSQPKKGSTFLVTMPLRRSA